MTPTVLADIGGTHARFAIAASDGPQNPEKLAVAAFDTPLAALADYAGRHRLAGGSLRIATAANPGDDGLWRFTNNPGWVIDRAAFDAAGWTIDVLADDFMASAYGVLALPPARKIQLRPGTAAPGLSQAVLGPGTGLGLAYIQALPGGGTHVQQTFGGHMLATTLTDEQYVIAKLVRRLKPGGTPVVPEDVASGRGLPLLYRAVCVYHGHDPVHDGLAAMLAAADAPMVRATLRLFHEYLGLFAHNAVVTGHAYGGLYLDGGIIPALRAADLFDFPAFEQFLCLDMAPVVKAGLDEMPVWLIDDPYTALHGLMRMEAEAGL